MSIMLFLSVLYVKSSPWCSFIFLTSICHATKLTNPSHKSQLGSLWIVNHQLLSYGGRYGAARPANNHRKNVRNNVTMWPYVTTIDLEQDNNWYDTFGQKEWDKTDYDGKYSIAIFAIAMFLIHSIIFKQNICSFGYFNIFWCCKWATIEWM